MFKNLYSFLPSLISGLCYLSHVLYFMFSELKKHPTHIMNIGSKPSLSLTSENPLDKCEDDDENLCPAQSSPPSASTPYRPQVKDTSSSDGSTFDDQNSSDSQIGDYRDTARDCLVYSFSVSGSVITLCVLSVG